MVSYGSCANPSLTGNLILCSVFVPEGNRPMTRTQIAELEALSEAEMIALASIEAAHGDAAQALVLAVEDAISLEFRLEEAVQSVSMGFVRGVLPSV